MLRAFILCLGPFSGPVTFQQPEAPKISSPEFVLQLKVPVRSILHNPVRGEMICATGSRLTAISLKSHKTTWAVDYATHAYEPVAICPKGKEMATVATDGITFWNLGTYERHGLINSGEYNYCYYMADGNVLVGHSFRHALVLDRNKPDETAIRTFPPGYSGAYVSPNGAVVFLSSSVLNSEAGPPGRVRIYDVGSDKARKDLFVAECEYEIFCLAASNDGRLLFVGDEGGNSVLIDTKLYKSTRLPAAKHAVGRAAFSQKADLVAYGDHWGNILVWDIANGRMVDQIRYHKESILGLAIVGERQTCLIAAGDRKGVVAFWKRSYR